MTYRYILSIVQTLGFASLAAFLVVRGHPIMWTAMAFAAFMSCTVYSTKEGK